MSASRSILVVEDERDILELVAFNLRRAGHDVTTAATGREALRLIESRTPDLIVLDVMLPELSGTEIVGRVRTNPATAHVPILLLTARSQESDQVTGLASGADDYVTKPFSVKVLTARVEALLRRASDAPRDGRTLAVGPVLINVDTHEASVAGEPAKFTLTEFRILAALAQARGRVLSRATLVGRAMGPGVTVTDRTIDVHVTAIRRRLGPHSGLLRTVRGVGYRLTDEPPEGS
jgi:two-component system phosphate regulon response regulator PhoB